MTGEPTFETALFWVAIGVDIVAIALCVTAIATLYLMRNK